MRQQSSNLQKLLQSSGPTDGYRVTVRKRRACETEQETSCDIASRMHVAQIIVSMRAWSAKKKLELLSDMTYHSDITEHNFRSLVWRNDSQVVCLDIRWRDYD